MYERFTFCKLCCLVIVEYNQKHISSVNYALLIIFCLLIYVFIFCHGRLGLEKEDCGD